MRAGWVTGTVGGLTGRVEPDAIPGLGKVDAGIRPVLATALAPDPGSRYPDAAAFLAALEEAAGRTYGAAWWTTAGVPALVAPSIAALVPLGGGAGAALGGAVASGVVGGAGAAGRRLPGKVLLGAVAAAVLIVGGGVSAIALAGNDGKDDNGGRDGKDDRDSSASRETESADAPDPVVDTVPSGVYTRRSVVTRTTDPKWQKVGAVVDDPTIWTITPDCDTAATCGGSIESTSGNSFDFTWDGSALTLVVPPNEGKDYEGTCTDNVTGEQIGTIDLRGRFRPPGPIPFRSSGALDPSTGLPAMLSHEYTYIETIVAYDNFIQESLPPRQCAFRSNGRTRHTATITVTLTAGADPEVVAGESGG